MLYRTKLGLLLSCLCFLLFAGSAKADTVDGVTFTVLNPDLTGQPGDTLKWMYTVNNLNPDHLQIALATINVLPGFAVTDGKPCALAFDGLGSTGTLDYGASWTDGILFAFTAAGPSVPNSFNSGKFDLTVYFSDFSSIDLLENYTAAITPAGNVPEPGSMSLLLSGLMVSFLALRKFAR
jgi:hypothetical protein